MIIDYEEQQNLYLKNKDVLNISYLRDLRNNVIGSCQYKKDLLNNGLSLK